MDSTDLIISLFNQYLLLIQYIIGGNKFSQIVQTHEQTTVQMPRAAAAVVPGARGHVGLWLRLGIRKVCRMQQAINTEGGVTVSHAKAGGRQNREVLQTEQRS